MTVSREKARQLSQRSTAIVKAYIQIQNSVFKFSIMKALGLKKTDPDQAAGQCRQLRDSLRAILAEFRGAELRDGVPVETFYKTLHRYLSEVQSAMNNFIDICGRIAEAQAEKNSPYWKTRYREDLQKLQDLEHTYLLTGLQLNQLWTELQNTPVA